MEIKVFSTNGATNKWGAGGSERKKPHRTSTLISHHTQKLIWMDNTPKCNS